MAKLPPGHYVRGGKGAGKEYVLNNCPGCSKKGKFYWNVFKLEGCCFSCGIVIKGWREFRKHYPDLDENAPEQGRQPVRNNGPERLPGSLIRADRSCEASDYLLSRYVDKDLADIANASYNPETAELVFPITSPEPGMPVSWVKRRISPEGQWIVAPGTTRSKYAYGWDYIPKDREQVVLVEGIFDVLSPGMLGYSVATFGITLSLDLLAWVNSRFRYVWLWYDPDASGDKARENISFALRAWGIRHSILRTPTDPGACRDQEFLRKLKNKLTLSITKEVV